MEEYYVYVYVYGDLIIRNFVLVNTKYNFLIKAHYVLLQLMHIKRPLPVALQGVDDSLHFVSLPAPLSLVGDSEIADWSRSLQKLQLATTI